MPKCGSSATRKPARCWSRSAGENDGVTRRSKRITTAALVIFDRQLVFTTFDPELAKVFGIPPHWVDTGFALALAATIVASMNIVGVTLIAAAIVIPPSTARQITQSFGMTLILSTAIGAFSGFVGMFLSYEYDVASGAAIVLLSAAIFAVVYLVTTIHRELLARRSVVMLSPARPSFVATHAAHDDLL